MCHIAKIKEKWQFWILIDDKDKASIKLIVEHTLTSEILDSEVLKEKIWLPVNMSEFVKEAFERNIHYEVWKDGAKLYDMNFGKFPKDRDANLAAFILKFGEI